MDTTKQHKLFKDNILQLDNEISKLRNQIYSNTYEQPSITPPPDSPYHPHSSYKTSHQQLNNTPNASSHPEAPTPTPTYTYYGLSPSFQPLHLTYPPHQTVEHSVLTLNHVTHLLRRITLHIFINNL